MDITRVGPLYNNAKMIRDLLADRERVAVVLVTLAEEMPVNETIELHEKLQEQTDIGIAGVVVNGVRPTLFSSDAAAECWDELREFGNGAGGSAARAVADAERCLSDRKRADKHIDRLRQSLGLPMAEIPLLARRDLDQNALEQVGSHLRWES